MSFLDDLEVKHDGALVLGTQAEWLAGGALAIRMSYHRNGIMPKANYWAEEWFWELNRAHFWAMYILALEENS